MCGTTFDTREKLRKHSSRIHNGMSRRQIMAMPEPRTLAIAAGITAGVVVAALVAWRIARRRRQAKYQ
jgi:type IV secretory pathway TrbD component